MACKSCDSTNQRELPAEINVHAPHGRKSVDKRSVFAFPSLLICMKCGFTQFVLTDAELTAIWKNLDEKKSADVAKVGT